MSAPLLIEIGCEEIPAGGIAGAAESLGRRIVAILDQAGLAHGDASAWGGSRRLAVRVEAVEGRQADREETVLGPPARAAFAGDGSPTAAAVGFARKHGIPPGGLVAVRTDKGEYSAFRRTVRGRSVGEVLGAGLEQAVGGMSFPKTMRWGEGAHRWVRPVHWLVALHGGEVLPLALFGIEAERHSRGHRFLSPGAVRIADAGVYAAELERAFVLADPAARRGTLARQLAAAAAAEGGEIVEDERLLEEVADLVEWPGVVTGRFAAGYLDLPREVLVATLRHHQKAFSVQRDGRLLPVFLAVANTDRDPAGHVRRGNEWVVGGRLEDARFFWGEDGKTELASRVARLDGIVYHEKLGTYREKAERVAGLAGALARQLGLPEEEKAAAERASLLCKADLLTGLVAEFPELQGVVGGLLLRREGVDERVAAAVYEHYRPRGPDDDPPATELGAVLSVADKLDAVASLLAAGERPTGSRDPFGLRRATAGIFRIACERSWGVSIGALWELSALATGGEQRSEIFAYLEQRLGDFLRERGFTLHEIDAVLQAGGGTAAAALPLGDVLARLEAVRAVRERADFRKLVELTKRASNILRQTAALIERSTDAGWAPGAAIAPAGAARRLEETIGREEPAIRTAADRRAYAEVLDRLAGFAEPVAAFFDEVLVVDPEDPQGTYQRHDLLARLGSLLTRYFDIRELPGDADRRP